MADEKTFIGQLNSADTANDTDIMIIEGEETKKISFLSLFNALKTKFSNIYKPINAITKADEVTYGNSTSGLAAKDVQGAIDEVDAKADKNASDIDVINTNLSNKVTYEYKYLNYQASGEYEVTGLNIQVPSDCKIAIITVAARWNNNYPLIVALTSNADGNLSGAGGIAFAGYTATSTQDALAKQLVNITATGAINGPALGGPSTLYVCAKYGGTAKNDVTYRAVFIR